MMPSHSFVISSLPKDCDALLGLDWFSKSKALIDPANRILTFPRKDISLIDNYEVVVEDECFLATEAAEVENFDDVHHWELGGHTIDLNKLSHLKKSEQDTVVQLLKVNDEVFASSYSTLGCCNLQPFEILTISETLFVTPPYRKSFKERELIKEEIKKMLGQLQ